MWRHTAHALPHSILDQQQKQSIPFSGGALLGEFDGKIFVARDRDLYALVPIPVETQVRTRSYRDTGSYMYCLKYESAICRACTEHMWLCARVVTG